MCRAIYIVFPHHNGCKKVKDKEKGVHQKRKRVCAGTCLPNNFSGMFVATPAKFKGSLPHNKDDVSSMLKEKFLQKDIFAADGDPKRRSVLRPSASDTTMLQVREYTRDSARYTANWRLTMVVQVLGAVESNPTKLCVAPFLQGFGEDKAYFHTCKFCDAKRDESAQWKSKIDDINVLLSTLDQARLAQIQTMKNREEAFIHGAFTSYQELAPHIEPFCAGLVAHSDPPVKVPVQDVLRQLTAASFRDVCPVRWKASCRQRPKLQEENFCAFW